MTDEGPDAASIEDAGIKIHAALHAMYAVIAEMVDGYRASLLNRGYSEQIAEQMTADFHREALPFIMKGGGLAAGKVPPT